MKNGSAPERSCLGTYDFEWRLYDPVRKIVPKRVVGQPLRSPIAGRMMGRSVPLLGEVLILYDITYKALDSFNNDNPKEFWEKGRENVTTMYHEDE